MQNSFFKKMVNDIEDFDVITIFAHQYPDPDAKGSACGLAEWIQNRYPSKKVLVFVSSADEKWKQPQGIQKELESDERQAADLIKNSLAIITDTSNSARVEDPRWKQAKKTIRIDHHVPVETFCDEEWIDEKATASCEMIALMLKENGQKIPAAAAQLLYEGLAADNLRFSIQNVTECSFEAGGWLVSQGADAQLAARNVFSSSYEDYQIENLVRIKSRKQNRFLFSALSQEDYLSLGTTFSKAKEKVYALGSVNEAEIWALFTEMEEPGKYSASLRSRTIPIRDLAMEYGGGGHECASGIKNLTVSQVAMLIEKLSARSEKPV